MQAGTVGQQAQGVGVVDYEALPKNEFGQRFTNLWQNQIWGPLRKGQTPPNNTLEEFERAIEALCSRVGIDMAEYTHAGGGQPEQQKNV